MHPTNRAEVRVAQRNKTRVLLRSSFAKQNFARRVSRVEIGRCGRTMNDLENPENPGSCSSYYALLVAFKTMKERCQQLQTRLAAVEQENVCLRLECGRDMSTAVVKADDNNADRDVVQTLQVREITHYLA